MKRPGEITVNREKTLAWRQRSRQALSRTAMKVKPRRDVVPAAVRAEVAARALDRCEIPGCDRAIDHLHHRRLRSQGGKHTAANLLATCWPHHLHIHDNPAEAYDAGWMIRAGGQD